MQHKLWNNCGNQMNLKLFAVLPRQAQTHSIDNLLNVECELFDISHCTNE